MRPYHFLLAALALFLAFTQSAGAIDLTGTCDSVSVQCDLQINYLTVCNSEPFTQTIVPSMGGLVPDWVKVLPENVTLGAGECETLETYTIAPCYEEPGLYSAQLNVNGESRSCEIQINQGHFVDIDIVPKEATVAQCETASYDIILSNNTIVPNQNEELVNLSIAGLDPQWANIESFQTIVTKGEPETIELNVLSPCDQAIGNYNFEVKASLFNPNFFSTESATYTIIQGQEFEIEIDETDFGAGTPQSPIEACVEEDRVVPVRIKNTGKQDDTLSIGIEGPEWITLSTDTLSIPQGEEREITLLMEKTATEQKDYTVKLTFTSQIFNFSISKEIFVRLSDCYNALLEFPLDQQNICKDQENRLEFTVKNDRDNPLDLQIEIDGITGSLDMQEIEIEGMSEKKFSFNVDTQSLAPEGTAEKEPLAIDILFDASGSMQQEIDGQRKIDIAKQAIVFFANNITPTDTGFRAFGHREECGESEQIEPIGPNGLANIPEKLKGFKPTGKTPLAATLEDAVADFEGVNGKKVIILVSDGKESCDGNPAQAAQKLAENGIIVYAIGFDIDETGKAQLQAVAAETVGAYFDAKNSNDLLAVLEEISRQLDIELSQTVQKSFTVKLSSPTFSLEKDFTLNVSDCHNIAVFLPELNVCRGLTGTETVTITNVGTQAQSLEIRTSPEFITASTQSVTLEPSQTTFVEVEFSPTQQSSGNEFIFTAESENLSVSGVSNINYLGETSCFGFDMIVLEEEFVGRIGEGERRKLLFINLGKAPMAVTLKSDQPWMYFEPDTVQLPQNGTGFANFYVTPPFDFSLLEMDAVAKITATNEYGLQVEKETRLVVTGPTFGLVPFEIRTEKTDSSKLPEDETGKDYLITFTISNTSDRTIEIRSVTIPGFETSTTIENMVLKQGEDTTVTVLVDIGERGGTISLPMVISTIDGSILQEIQIETELETPAQPEEEIPPAGTGFLGLFGLAELSAIIILALILLTIPTVVFFMLKLRQKKEEKIKEESKKEETKAALQKETKTEKPKARKKAKQKSRKTKAAKKK